MPYNWPEDTQFEQLTLDVEDKECVTCGRTTTICDHRFHKIHTFDGPLKMTMRLTHCPDKGCGSHSKTISPEAEFGIAMPYWAIGWDVYAWIGQRRFSRHWSVPQMRFELMDSYKIELSDDAIENYIHRYEIMLAARRQDPELLKKAYEGIDDLILSIDGLQPEKGHETLYVIRELRAKRVWFAVPLLSSAESEIKKLIEQAQSWAERLGKPVRAWVSDKQGAFVNTIAEVFPEVPHRYCQNHFIRDVAKPVLDADSAAKVQLRSRVRGLRTIEREILEKDSSEEGKKKTIDAGEEVVLDYCSAIRGILNSNQGSPIYPAGLRMRDALKKVQRSLQVNMDLGRDTLSHAYISQLAGRLETGFKITSESFRQIRRQTKQVQAVQKTLDPNMGNSEEREEAFATLKDNLAGKQDAVSQHMAKVMESFKPGLFVGGDDVDIPQDNLDLERWFKNPKSHERRIHGHRHVGTRIVQEGPTTILALDAHWSHPYAFSPQELQPYHDAQMPRTQKAAIHRRKIMRKARSRKKLKLLLKDLEKRYGTES